MSENSTNGPAPEEPNGPGQGAASGTGSDTENESQAAVIAKEVEDLERRSETAARLFDVRRIIGGLFVLYGVIVTIAGITASDADIKKAQDININLWTGIGMLLLGIFFLVWLKLSPTIPPPALADEGAAEESPST